MVCPQKMSHEFGDMIETTQPYLCYLPDKVLTSVTRHRRRAGGREGDLTRCHRSLARPYLVPGSGVRPPGTPTVSSPSHQPVVY